MTSTMEHPVEDQEEKMRILFDKNKEDLKENGINLERDTELLIIEDLPSPIAMETSDFNGRSDETISPDPDKSDKSRTDTGLGTSEDLTIPSSPLTEDCVSPLMEDNVFPDLEDSNTASLTQEIKPSSDHVDLEDSKNGTENSNSQSKNDLNSSVSNSKFAGELQKSSKESSEMNKCKEDDDIKEDSSQSNVSAGLPPIMEEVASNIPPVKEEITPIIPPIIEEASEDVPQIIEEVAENISPVTKEITSNIPPVKEELTKNIPPISEDVTDSIPLITEEVAANIPPIVDDITSNIPVQEELFPVVDIESNEDIVPGKFDDSCLETQDKDGVAEVVSLVTKETSVNTAGEHSHTSSSVTTENSSNDIVEAKDSHDMKKKENPNKLTIDSVTVNSDSLESVDLPVTPGSQGSCDPPMTPSSMAADFTSHEVQTLQTELQQTHNIVKQLQAIILKERVTHNHNVAILKMRLQEKEQECRNNAARSDKQLGEVIAHLLLLEGQLKKEHSQVRCKMADSEKIIQKQEEDIESLKETNQRLLEAVRDAYGRKGKNGVMLLENLSDDKTGSSESLESPTLKSPPSLKSPLKGKWGSMKDKMTRKHRSSLDLSDTDFDGNQGLLIGRQYGSQESLLMIGRKSKEIREGRDKKCRSIAGYPDSSLVGLMEVPDENENRLDNFSHSKVLSGGIGNKNQRENVQNTNTLQVSLNGIEQSSAGLLSAISMPILSQTDKNSNPAPAKERPKSISSIEHISSHDSGGTPDLPPPMEAYPPPPKSPGATSNSSISDSSNPFKNLKTILKRKGSKIKGKKRSVTMADSPSQDYQAAVKKHFEKYDMS
ncbi:uncharacterized protein DDB_G0284459-like [Ylistrum balloti]|uniref:uncharacterized protein DDB_G0284459-like n=1 Tax=Ylistrum balloti TaxID=509963 RepID=UPI002905C3B2|nr:uncharacterized protein DDB_G0284459-like [Ylistrum balloti]